jgi:acetoacetyl-CoA reductase
MAELAGRTALVTGGSRGIGRAIAEALGAEGVSLVLGYWTSAEAADELRRDLDRRGVPVEVVQADVTAEDSPELLVGRALERFGRLDLLVNNAGINRDATIRKLTRGQYEEVLDVNFLGAALLAQAAMATMAEAGFGRIVNIASFVGQKGNFGQANYAASKAALIAWGKTAALEWARHGITVNSVCPGFVDTDMLRSVPENVRDDLLGRIPLARFARPDEIADAVLFALRSDYMTGAEVNVNGGVHM